MTDRGGTVSTDSISFRFPLHLLFVEAVLPASRSPQGFDVKIVTTIVAHEQPRYPTITMVQNIMYKRFVRDIGVDSKTRRHSFRMSVKRLMVQVLDGPSRSMQSLG